MALKKSQLYSSVWSSCDELRGGMDASQYQDQINKKMIAPLADANKLSEFPDFNDAAKLGSGKEKVDRLTNVSQKTCPGRNEGTRPLTALDPPRLTGACGGSRNPKSSGERFGNARAADLEAGWAQGPDQRRKRGGSSGCRLGSALGLDLSASLERDPRFAHLGQPFAPIGQSREGGGSSGRRALSAVGASEGCAFDGARNPGSERGRKDAPENGYGNCSKSTALGPTFTQTLLAHSPTHHQTTRRKDWLQQHYLFRCANRMQGSAEFGTATE